MTKQDEKMAETQYERGPTHGQHTRKFYWILGVSLVVIGMIGGVLIAPDDWHLVRKLLAGALFGLWSGFCVFAWHTLTDTIVEE